MGTEAVNGLTGGETENPNVSTGLAGFECSPLPAERANLVADRTQFQPHGSPAVSAAGKWVNRRDTRITRRSLACCAPHRQYPAYPATRERFLVPNRYTDLLSGLPFHRA